ncbi:immunity 53 family protein [Terrisporobacter glycolicus]|uniref:Rhodanese-related sulfurtransferase n=1 Tax=Terrisporobacter glycolicus ATCC 14880 = DSM 1288 TaxID=1121315 RepID=A0ABZ2EQK4_9FIRM|nr:immunity 53 family protein [Terrisporobacter glycolicus]
MNLLEWLENWYNSNCDGDWEHMYGVKIETVDNPGWSINIDLIDTYLEQKEFSTVKYDKGNEDWIICIKEDGVFKGSGGPKKLNEIIFIFKSWIEKDEEK